MSEVQNQEVEKSEARKPEAQAPEARKSEAQAPEAVSQVEGGAEAEKKDDLPQAVVTIEEAGAARKRMKLEIPAERIKAKLEESFGELQRDAVIQGFRRGRAPRRLIEKRFGSNIRDTVKQQVIAEAYQKAIEDNKLEVLGDPDTDLSKVEMKDGETLVLSVEVEVAPEFELPSIEKIAVKRPKLEATEERLNLAVENLRKYFGHWHDATGGATDKDTVTADVKVLTEDGTIVAEQAAVAFPVVMTEGPNIAGIKFESLTEKLKGAKIGDAIALEGTLPADHPDEKHRGMPVKITLAVKAVKHQDLPEVTKEFAEMLGFESVDELKKDLNERLVVQLEQETQGAVAQQVYRYLLSNTNLELPAKLSQRQMTTVLRRRATELMQKGVPENEIVQQIDALRISSAQQAAVDLRLFFIMSKLAEQFGVEVTEEEVNSRVVSIAMQYGRRPEKLRSQMSASGQLEQLHLQIRDGKVVDKLVEMGEVTEVDEKTLAEEFKNLPPLSGVGPHVTGVSQSAKK
jgi:trigger factor